MTKKVKVSELPEFDAAEYLNSEEDVAAYLTTVLEENDSACWRPRSEILPACVA